MAESKKKFELQAKKIFLTYSDSNLNKETIEEALKEWGAIKYAIGRELHASGKPHWHVAMHLHKKLHIKNERHFDLPFEEHPNIKTIKNWEEKVAYCMKDGEYWLKGIEWFKTFTGFKRKREDLNGWLRYVDNKKMVPVEWPITLPGGGEAKGPGEKKRHYWIVGPPDSGKTTWVEDTFQGKRIYKRTATNYPFDGYDGEDVIIYDDIFPKFEEVAAVSNVYKTKTHVYGATRYNEKHWPMFQERVMFVLANVEPMYGPHQEAFDSRFNLIQL